MKIKKINPKKIPPYVFWILKQFKKNQHEAFIVGGCVRDLFLEREAKDWDITTNALPEKIISIFENEGMKVVYKNHFGTVTVIDTSKKEDELRSVEITPFRIEGKYQDARHPEKIQFSQSIHEDLKRRDFTINAIAYDPIQDIFVDDYSGIEDIKKGIIRTVGKAKDRFGEDALRMMRAVRFASQLGFFIEEKTMGGIKENAALLKKISKERIRDEFTKIVDAPYAKDGIESLKNLSLLDQFIPELLENVGIEQGGSHKFDVWNHLLYSLEHASKKDYPLHVKFAALFHDIGKARTRKKGEKKEWTFYGHEQIGAQMTKKILERLRFPKDFSKKVVTLVRYHMFFSDPDTITLSAVRRIIQNVGKELIWDLIKLRISDRVGMGRPKEEPYRLRKYEAMIEEALHDPISVKMLHIDGNILMNKLNIQAGPKIGWILYTLLEEVLENPKKNEKSYLLNRAKELSHLPESELQLLGEKGKEKKEKEEEDILEKMYRKYHVDYKK